MPGGWLGDRRRRTQAEGIKPGQDRSDVETADRPRMRGTSASTNVIS
jgi:hypothetical protein